MSVANLSFSTCSGSTLKTITYADGVSITLTAEEVQRLFFIKERKKNRKKYDAERYPLCLWSGCTHRAVWRGKKQHLYCQKHIHLLNLLERNPADLSSMDY
jgi:hypothetical protein